MTAFVRIASGSFATWSRVAITLVSQLALVPVYLSFWPAETYGIWLALQTFYALGTIFGMAHLTFLENEFIRIGAADIRALERTLWSAVPIAVLVAVAQLLAVIGLWKTGLLAGLLAPNTGGDSVLITAAVWVALAQMVNWLIMVAAASVVVRALCGIGYYARYAWLGVPFVLFNAAIPVAVLAGGGDLLEVGLSQVAVTFLFNAIWLLDGIRIAARSGIKYAPPDLRLGFLTLRRSLYVLLRLFLEMARQTGFRLVMLPVVGPGKLAEFSTQRTAGNTVTQCMNSVYAPLLPELMRYVRDRKQEHMEGAFGILWMLLVLVFCPLTVVLQTVMPAIFPWWTRHAFAYDGVLLCYLSAGVLVNMVSMPAIAICSANNLVALQLRIAVVAAILLFGALLPLTHVMGIRGAAVALLIGELGASALYVRDGARWIRGAGLAWPVRSFNICAIAVTTTISACALIALWPHATESWLAIYLAAWSLGAMSLWNAAPNQARRYLADRIKELAVAARGGRHSLNGR